jgi:NhaA family Na+:H+ antiporter
MSHANPGEHDAPKTMFQRFFHSEVSGSIVLLFCTVIALVWANSPWAESYFDLAHKYIGVSWGDATFRLSLQHWVNDGLMVIFFFVVGLEIKREIVAGQLSSRRLAGLPVSAALGGMAVPALVYAGFNAGGPGASGWGVPMATDIAFALGILALFGARAPLGLKVFLTALAIADDIGAVLVIALFYTETIVLPALVVAGVFLALLFLAHRVHLRRPGIYILLGIGCWAAVFASGVHATVAGILVAMMVPVKARIEPGEFRERAARAVERLEDLEAKGAALTRDSMLAERDQLAALDDLYAASGAMRPSGITLEYFLHPIQAFFILPLFALFNAGVAISADSFAGGLAPVTIGIVAGLFLGKQVGIMLFSWLALKTGRASMPDGVTWPMIWGASCLAGVGFTMSLFISELAFRDQALINEAKIGILIGSLISGLVGYVLLRWAFSRKAA